MVDGEYLAEVRRILIQCLWVAHIEDDPALARELELEIHRLRDRWRFPRIRMLLLAPDRAPTTAALILFERAIERARGGVTR